jgi:phosphoribosylformylglycinamidine synthase
MLNTLLELINNKAILSSRVVTEGGLVVALAKMSFMNEVGILSTIDTGSFSEKLFNESLSIVVQINNKDIEAAQKTLETNNIPFDIIGITTSKKTIKINDKVSLLIKDAKNIWENSLRKKLLS